MHSFRSHPASVRSEAKHRGDGSGGLHVPKEMHDLNSQPAKHLSIAMKSLRLRDLYVTHSATFEPTKLTWFGFCCYYGLLEDVTKAIENGNAPDIEGSETPYKFGYCTLILAGAQRTVPLAAGALGLKHLETLKYLLKCGAPPDLPDIVGFTALHHGTMSRPQLALCRVLLENGANPNHQDRYGCVPILATFMKMEIGALELLMEFGADMDVMDADGITPRNFQLKAGAEVTAAVQKWMRKRSGEDKHMTSGCENCRKEADAEKLQVCSRCRTARYCSAACQKEHWKKTHKARCVPFNEAGGTVTLRPFYDPENNKWMQPVAEMARTAMDIPFAQTPESHYRGAHAPRNPKEKALIVKVQVPYDVYASSPHVGGNGDLMVYTQKRNFVSRIRRQDCPDGYDKISHVVRTKGVGGAKAYFAAELKTKNELVVKISEVLAEQPF